VIQENFSNKEYPMNQKDETRRTYLKRVSYEIEL